MQQTESNAIESLALRSQQGERNALDALIHAIQPDIYKLALRFLFDPTDAEDATQEILLKIVTRLIQFDRKSRFKTWAYAVAKNHLLDIKRRPMEQLMDLSEFANDLQEGLSTTIEESQEHELLIQEVRVGCTLAMLQCLDRPSRLIYILGEILELDHSEASKVLEISPDTYRKRLSRVRKKISQFMIDNCGLVNTNNQCQCEKRIPTAIRLGRIDPQYLKYARPDNLIKQQQLRQTIQELKLTQRAASLFRSQNIALPEKNLTEWLKTTLAIQTSGLV